MIAATCLAIAATWLGTAGNDVSHVLGSSHKAVHIDLETVELPEPPFTCKPTPKVLGCLDLY